MYSICLEQYSGFGDYVILAMYVVLYTPRTLPKLKAVPNLSSSADTILYYIVLLPLLSSTCFVCMHARIRKGRNAQSIE